MHRHGAPATRRPARVAVAAALVVAVAATVLLATPPARGALTTDQAGADPTLDDPLAETGAALYQLRCAACHGTSGQGRPGEGLTAGPPLRGLPTAYVDLTLRTGRMPLLAGRGGVTEERLADDERRRLVDWATAALDLDGGVPAVGEGEAAAGQVVYLRHCAACHGATGGGGIAGSGTRVPPLHRSDAVAVVEALRVGPFEMPAFGDQVITDDEADDVSAYVTEVLGAEPPAGSVLGLREVGPTVGAALTAVVVALLWGLVVLVDRVGRRRGEVVEP